MGGWLSLERHLLEIKRNYERKCKEREVGVVEERRKRSRDFIPWLVLCKGKRAKRSLVDSVID